jgi:hypothetical protein
VKTVTEPEKVILSSDIPQDWPNPLEHEAYDEEHDLVLH